MAIRHVHSSSRYDRSEQSLAKEAKAYAKATDPQADLITYTEVKSREDALRDALEPEFGCYQPDQTDVAICWRKDKWAQQVKEVHKITDKVWTDGQGHKHETWVATALLKRNDGHLLWISLCHLPSNVEAGCKVKENKQGAAWKSALNGWKSYWDDSRKKHHPDVGMIVADWNIDFHVQCWRQYVAGVWPNLVLCWRDPNMPKGGTHGSRLIDASWGTVKPNKAWLLPDNNASDHRPWAEVIEWPT